MSKKDPQGIEIFGAAARPSAAGSQPSSKKASSTSAVAEPVASKRRSRWLGVIALVIAVAFAVADGYAIAVAIGDYYELAIVLAVVAIVGTGIAFLLGAVALVLGRGRWFGLAAMVLSVLANPFTLVQLLLFFSDFTAS